MIYINKELRINKIDDRNLQIEQYRKCIDPKTKQETYKWKWVGYYGDLRSAIGGVLKHCLFSLAEEEIKDLKALVARIDDIDKELKGAINERM